MGEKTTRRISVLYLVLGLGFIALLVAAVLVFRLLAPTSAEGLQGNGLDAVPTSTPSMIEEQPAPEPEPEPVPSTFTIASAGDVLPHMPVHSSAKTANGHDFSPLLDGITPLVARSALALCHLEVPTIGAGQTPTGYPMFGSVAQIVTDLNNQGWDGCSTASNHSVDRGFDGVVHTIDELDGLGMGFAGTARTQQEATPQFYVVTHGEYETVVAHLSYTYGLNGLPMPHGAPFAVNLIDPEVIISQAQKARQEADLVVVSIHEGIEYQTQPSQAQLDIAQALADSAQIDLYIGHHAHVPQPIVNLPGGPDDQGMWTAYGLGNMISNQDTRCCVADTSNGLMMLAEIERDGDSPARVTGVTWRALTVDIAAGHKLYDLTEIARLGTEYGNLTAAEIAARHERVLAAVGDQAPESLDLPQDDVDSVEVVQRSK